MHPIMLDRERERLLRYRPASPNALAEYEGEKEDAQGATLPTGAGPAVDAELLAYAEERPVAPRFVEGVGEVIFVAVRPLGRYELSELNIGFFGYTEKPESDAAVRAVFEEALEAGAFE